MREYKAPTKQSKRKSHYSTKIVRNVYIDKKEFESLMKKRHYTCECWGVAGHKRHLKSGKVVKVRPYRKGVKRNDPNAYQPKTYEVAETNDTPS